MGNKNSNTSKNNRNTNHNVTNKNSINKNIQLLNKLNHLSHEQIINLRVDQKKQIISWLSKNNLQLQNNVLKNNLYPQNIKKANIKKTNIYELNIPSHTSSYEPSKFQKKSQYPNLSYNVLESQKTSQIPNSRLDDIKNNNNYQSRMRPNVSIKNNNNITNAYEQEFQQRRVNNINKHQYNPRVTLPEMQKKQTTPTLENQYQKKYQQRTVSNNQNYLNTIQTLGIDDQQNEETERPEVYNFVNSKNTIKNTIHEPKSSNRRSQFESELDTFNNSGFDAVQILGLQSNFNLNDLKKSYRRAAIKTHPDRPGGNEEQFEIVTKAYMYLIEKIKREVKDKQYDELKSDYQDFEENRDQKINIDLSKKFNLNAFNTIYSENRINEPTDKGYGGIMENNKVREDIEIPNVFSKKFNVNIFNNTFEDLKEDDPSNMQIVKIDNPSPVNASNKIQYSELGQGNINDFGSNINIYNGNSLQYTDYKKAHVTQTKLIDAKKVKTTQYRNIKELEKARSNISFEMNDGDKIKLLQRQELEKQQELERRRRLFQKDQNVQDQYHSINQLTLGRN